MNTQLPLAPVSLSERLFSLDLLRGFALLGILSVNMAIFSSPVYLMFTGGSLFHTAWDRAAEILITFFAEGKFYSLFSFLFGYGFSIQLLRAADRGKSVAPVYARRLLVLLAIGLIHAFLIWMGDILTIYALFGFGLLLFRKIKKDRTLLIWAAVFLLLPVLFNGLAFAAVELGRNYAPQEIETSFAAQDAEFQRLTADSLAAYAHGSWLDITSQRATDVLNLYSYAPFWVPPVFGMFLIGLWAGRKRIFQRLESLAPSDGERHVLLLHLRRLQLRALALGLIGNLIYTWASIVVSPAVPSLETFLGSVGFSFGAPALCFFYASSLVLLAQKPKCRPRLEPIASLGRMALTNYLLQSVVCTLLFYNYGLGLYGKVGPALGLAITFALYSSQIPASRWWLRSHSMGPVESLWRRLTYPSH